MVTRMNWLSDLAVTLIAQAAPAAGEAAAQDQPVIQGPANTILQFLPLIAVGIFFYFLMIRPQSQEAKKREQLLKELKKDDRVVTIGGIIGTISNISANGKEVTLKMDDNSKVRFLRSAIQGLYAPEEQEAESKSS